MPETRWTTFDLIFFDCDSTLSTIEGIDELARIKGKELRVGLLTDKAMNGELDLSDVYEKRLKAIRPTRGQLKAVEQRYWETQVEDAHALIQALLFLKKQTFIISGGLIDAVRGFGHRLGVTPDNIRAVELEYNQLSGQWWNYHEPATSHNQTYLGYDNGPLTETSGKPDIIRELSKGKFGRRLMVGDGSSDLSTSDHVELFVGFGGVIARDKVMTKSPIAVESTSIAPILPLTTGSAGYNRLKDSPHLWLYEKGINLLFSDKTHFNQPHLETILKRDFDKQ